MDVIYFKTSQSSFVLTDQRILEKDFSVKTYFIDNVNALHYAFALLKLTGFLIFQGWRPKIYFIRFADWHTALLVLFSKLYQKKLIIVVGGFDAFHLPEFGYGVYHRRFRGWCAKYSLRHAHVVLPNSPCLIDYVNDYALPAPFRGGIRYFVPDMHGKIRVIPNGFDSRYWVKDPAVRKKNTVITVASITNIRNYQLKGIDSFVQLSARFPDYAFMIIGMHRDFIRVHFPGMNLPANLELREFVPREQLRMYYGEARVFCLFSLTEGMSNVLCEAMLCECIPVGSNVTFIPEIIGETGFIISHRDLDEMAEAIKAAFHSDSSLGQKARQRIIDHYHIDIREKALHEVIINEMNT